MLRLKRRAGAEEQLQAFRLDMQFHQAIVPPQRAIKRWLKRTQPIMQGFGGFASSPRSAKKGGQKPGWNIQKLSTRCKRAIPAQPQKRYKTIYAQLRKTWRRHWQNCLVDLTRPRHEAAAVGYYPR